MNIINVRLNNFRNIKYLEIALSPGINLFYGMNGQGKTNILESVEILSTTKSEKASKEIELINHDADFGSVSGKFYKNNLDFEIDILLSRQKRKTCVKNGKNTTPDSVFGSVNIVKFFPDDIEIIKGGPQSRRRYMDMEISLIDRVYYNNYKNYIKIIETRNQLLKKASDSFYSQNSSDYKKIMTMIESYDELLPPIAYMIYSNRVKFLNEIYPIANKMHRLISADAEDIEIKYNDSANENISEFIELSQTEYMDRLIFLLKNNLKNDIIKGHTGAGPHKDDITFLINKNSAKLYGSTGQVKTLAISLKLAQIEYIYKKLNDYPVLLIDDLTSEFDRERLFNIISNISDKIQAMVTCTNHNIFMEAGGGLDIRYFKVKNGGIEEN
ncbi:MAG: DNA replication/repair protein RecF [Candidatus Wallbacteria bacterium]